MNKNNPKILYDKKSRVLSIEVKKGKSVDSDIQGNIVVDYDKRGDILRFNIYDFSFERFKDKMNAVKSFAHDSSLPFVVR